jgi:hypothetical protein
MMRHGLVLKNFGVEQRVWLEHDGLMYVIVLPIIGASGLRRIL